MKFLSHTKHEMVHEYLTTSCSILLLLEYIRSPTLSGYCNFVGGSISAWWNKFKLCKSIKSEIYNVIQSVGRISDQMHGILNDFTESTCFRAL